MAFKSLVTPNLGFRVLAGNCLAMAQGIVGAAVRHNSATDAANATKHRHANRDIPNAVCVLWFDHTGTYGSPGAWITQNWGHVVVFVPGYGYASSSPVAGEVSTPYYYGSIAEVERAFNCSFRFWSEDINGTRACQEEADIVTPQDKKDIAEMTAKLILDTKIKQQGSKKGGTTTLRTTLEWMDHQWASTKRPLEWIGEVGPKIAAALGIKK